MKLYADKEQYKLYHGNMLDMLKVIEPNSIDSIICDPPYELNFMGKGWDNSGIAFNKEAWSKCYEVLKSGGYLLAFGGTRTYHRIACAIEDAGFEIRDCILYLYGMGFPKSLDISKAIDKNKNVETLDVIGKWLKEKRESKGLTREQVANELGLTPTAIYNWEEKPKQYGFPAKENWNKIKKIYAFDGTWDDFKKEAQREVIGKKENQMSGWNMDGTTKFTDRDITLPSTDLAKQWNGWGTALKPAYEPIIVARKPFKTSVAENIMQYGVGGINIDECRIGTEERFNNPPSESTNNWKALDGNKRKPITQKGKTIVGRFPANVIHDGSEEAIKDMPNTKCGLMSQNIEGGNFNVFGKQYPRHVETIGDEGSASRYFYCAKASKKDRDEGLDMFDSMQVNDGRNTPIDNAFQRGETQRKNIHPTVKPIELMQYLVKMVSPKGSTILDCFMGSGSTGKAVMFENRERDANYKFIGIELTEEYLPICEARIDYALNKYEYDFKKELDEQKKEGQANIFDLIEE